ncbi:hypothetical protein ACH5RR_040772 [Cinchona calisaya]|uniref:Uncharacterized protein n=1 Tax=Cinchona calisaya TaxID=153742 RepID=A0ABD2XX05_9GENT
MLVWRYLNYFRVFLSTFFTKRRYSPLVDLLAALSKLMHPWLKVRGQERLAFALNRILLNLGSDMYMRAMAKVKVAESTSVNVDKQAVHQSQVDLASVEVGIQTAHQLPDLSQVDSVLVTNAHQLPETSQPYLDLATKMLMDDRSQATCQFLGVSLAKSPTAPLEQDDRWTVNNMVLFPSANKHYDAPIDDHHGWFHKKKKSSIKVKDVIDSLSNLDSVDHIDCPRLITMGIFHDFLEELNSKLVSSDASEDPPRVVVIACKKIRKRNYYLLTRTILTRSTVHSNNSFSQTVSQ